MKHPSAMLGLSLTCRVQPNALMRKASSEELRKESFGQMCQYLGVSMKTNQEAVLLHGVMEIEKTLKTEKDWSNALGERGRATIDEIVTYGGLDGQLEIDLIYDCTKKGSILPTNSESKTDTGGALQPMSYSLQRQIVHDPTNAKLWLSLAKELIANDDGHYWSSQSSARIAAKRASNMLEKQLIDPRPNEVVGSQSVDASLISEAISLSFWLESSGDNEKSNGKGNSDVDEGPSETVSIFDLQRSLLMCPNNRVAREAIKLC